ncbi:class I SAM-dependent methyltransferase [Streptomyces sp. NPDC086669]|uniref:class I SAM-dependent methyltransferase n=1 Tax=Streptomyces sp. NPDC086669 TaxID=3365753 RepID=UPI00380CAA8B
MLPDSNAPVLDAGCGSGRDYIEFSSRGVDVMGVDLSIGLLKLAEEAGCRKLAMSDLRKLPVQDASFAGVWSCASLVHMPPSGSRKAVSEFGRVLMPGGVLFLTVRHGSGTEWRNDGAGGSRWFQLYGKDELESIVTGVGFSIQTSVVEPGLVRGSWISVFATKGPK